MEPSLNSCPPPLVVEDQDQPAYWAQSALQTPWSRGRHYRQQPGTLLNALQSHKLRREPVIRSPRQGDDLYYTIGTKTANIEALLVQSTGKKIAVDAECESCQKSQGPLARDSVRAVLRGHDERILELQAMKVALQDINKEAQFGLAS
ncbi:hypothetical protein N7478_008052 [Penicillium angulare]|uniref:uncharacterized protein n=1 Tax=Penicillium angulare TaxID=116970 RepID=UPI0025421909|nr:uncharacterized protein N7478_008052 [Penicillium angulare]KAJ5272927.1 hypothetical protein N7478_008052 [Penicillium angulare]